MLQDDETYRALAELRYAIRRFVRFSEQAARTAGLEPQQHQLLLALRGLAGGEATVREVAEWLQLQHNSTVELLDRLEARGFVSRRRSTDDRRVVKVTLLPAGEEVLASLSRLHAEELREAAPELVRRLAKFAPDSTIGGIAAGGNPSPDPVRSR